MEVVREFPDSFQIVGLAANSNIDLLEKQLRAFKVPYAAVGNEDAASRLRHNMQGSGCSCWGGEEGVLDLVRLPGVDLVLVAVTGVAGLKPTLEALSLGIDVALANKETLVAGGELVMRAAAANKTRLLPVDSEHSAIFQCIGDSREVERVIITGSGGPFRKTGARELCRVTPEMALQHPTWSMGKKITIDSATLMNKGLEVIEARWLFGIDYSSIDVVIHPQSIVHGLVKFQDGAILAQLGWPDMRLPIQYALFYPERKANSLRPFDLVEAGKLTFEAPDAERFPCLELAREAGRCGGTMAAVMNASNEVAVYAFLDGEIGFTDIPGVIRRVMDRHRNSHVCSLDEILEADLWARRCTRDLIEKGF